MIPLLTKGSLVVLESLTFTKTLYAFDFDGTLSKIVDHPEDATMAKMTADLLERLIQLAPVAIVSGRSIKDLKQRLDVHPQFLIGNHGLEEDGADSRRLKNAREICSVWTKKLNGHPWPGGIEIEDKDFSLALHYRRARNKKTARRELAECIRLLEPAPRLIQGKLVMNLLPEGAPHKGSAVLDLLKKTGLKHAFYIGDDDTDEDVFGLPPTDGQVMTVRVGKKKASQAQYFIPRQTDINQVLKLLVEFHEKSGKSM